MKFVLLWCMWKAYGGTFDVERVKVILGSFGALFLQNGLWLKKFSSEIGTDGNLGIESVCGTSMGNFDFKHANVIFGVIRCTFFKLGHNSKTTHHRAKRTKIWAWWAYDVCTRVRWILNMSSLFSGRLVCFSQS